MANIKPNDDSLDNREEMLYHIKEMFEEKKLIDAYVLTQHNRWLAIVLAFFFAPWGYAYIKKYEFMAISLLSINYFFLGFIIAPVHIYMMFTQADDELKGAA